MPSLTLAIEGMSCNHCLNAVNQALSALPGVSLKSVRIGGAVVSYDSQIAEPAGIVAAVEKAGYRVVGSSE